MTKQIIIERTIKAINLLPIEKAEEIVDFAEFLSKCYEEYLVTAGIQKLTLESKTFDFLNDDPEFYALSDFKEIYNAQG